MRNEKPITTFKVQKGNITLGHEYWSQTTVHCILKRLNRAIRNIEQQTVKYFINLNMIQQMQYVYLFCDIPYIQNIRSKFTQYVQCLIYCNQISPN